MLHHKSGRESCPGGGERMTKVQKSISLDEYTAPIANEKGNFSEWVRNQLIADKQQSMVKASQLGEDGELVHIAMRSKGKCWPFHPNGVCTLCWPQGPPTDADWRSVVRGEWEHEDWPPGTGWGEIQGEDELESIHSAVQTACEICGSNGGSKRHTHFVRRTFRKILTWL